MGLNLWLIYCFHDFVRWLIMMIMGQGEFQDPKMAVPKAYLSGRLGEPPDTA